MKEWEETQHVSAKRRQDMGPEHGHVLQGVMQDTSDMRPYNGKPYDTLEDMYS